MTAAPHARAPVVHAPVPKPAGGAQRPAAETTSAVQARLRSDCADGTIDGAFAQPALRRALGHSDAGAEYGDCHRALLQATT